MTYLGINCPLQTNALSVQNIIDLIKCISLYGKL